MPLKTIILALSLLLNIMLIAFVITGEARKSRPSLPGFGERSGPPGLERLSRYESLTDTERQTMREAMRDRLPEIREKRRQAHDAHRAYNRALTEQSFDAEELKALSRVAADLRRDLHLLSQDIMIEAMASLPEEKRKLLMEERNKRHESSRGRFHDRRGRHKKPQPE